MRSLYCFFFGHRLFSIKSKKGYAIYKTCSRCSLTLVRDYHDGWQKASRSEREYLTRNFGHRPE